ncbi:ras guanine nucleotide exchange factor i-related [Anaeramoeba ignava]|uniref:Ras guanine nucleotide exchange factor i-related n=1 Tax=Anaeramoeba ignava TaxID=1746090 RepID=A0A9Q0RDG3_ANAIG|nr:ras guanine nucleotide exchange factor i-related [Anaeramoeba ignava]
MDQLKNLKNKKKRSYKRTNLTRTTSQTLTEKEQTDKEEERIRKELEEKERIRKELEEKERIRKQQEEEEERIRKQKEEEERIRKQQEEEEERIRKQKEEEERIRKQEEEEERIRKQKEEEERIRKQQQQQEEERIRKQKEEEERIRKQEEEERIRKQKEEEERIRKQQQQKEEERIRKQKEEERIRKEEEERIRKQKEEEERIKKQEEERIKKEKEEEEIIKKQQQQEEKMQKELEKDEHKENTNENDTENPNQNVEKITLQAPPSPRVLPPPPKNLPPPPVNPKLQKEEEKIQEKKEKVINYDEKPHLRFETEEEESLDDVYIWKEPNDSESNILLADKSEIKAANLNKLIEKLTSQQNYGVTLDTFLMTYQSFTTPKKLLTKLIQRYHVPKTQNENEDEYAKRKKVIQIKVINVCTKWIENHFSDFTEKILKELHEFIDQTLAQDDKLIAKKLRDTVIKKQKGIDKKKIIHESENIPEPKVPKNIFNSSLSLLDVDEEEIARQLTLVEFDIFSQIKPSELLNQAWSKPKLRHRAKNVLAMIQRFNDLSGWVSTTIINCDKLKHRVRVLTRFLKILEFCRQLNNFNAVMALLAGFNSSAIYRLKFTWGEIPRRQIEVFDQLEKEMSSDSSYKGYREALKGVNPPCIPYLGVHLTDLTFIEDGNPDFIGNLINFSKRLQISKVIRNIQQYQQKGYELQPVHQIQQLLIKFKNLGETETYDKSLKIEPRNADIEDIQ